MSSTDGARRATAPERGGTRGGIGNRSVGLLLRSPLHRLLDGSMMLITIRGRKTGRAFTFPVQYARDGDTVWVLVGNRDRKTWWRNLRREAPVRLRLRGRDVEATAQALDGAVDLGAVVEGLHAYLAKQPRAAKSVGVSWHADRGFDDDEIKAAAERSVLVRIRLT